MLAKRLTTALSPSSVFDLRTLVSFYPLIMVRRRTRANVAPNKAPANGILENGSAVALTNTQLLEDQYFASPKRKDCKIEDNSSSSSSCNEMTSNGVVDDEVVVRSKSKTPSPSKLKAERGGLTGKTIGKLFCYL